MSHVTAAGDVGQTGIWSEGGRQKLEMDVGVGT